MTITCLVCHGERYVEREQLVSSSQQYDSPLYRTVREECDACNEDGDALCERCHREPASLVDPDNGLLCDDCDARFAAQVAEWESKPVARGAAA